MRLRETNNYVFSYEFMLEFLIDNKYLVHDRVRGDTPRLVCLANIYMQKRELDTWYCHITTDGDYAKIILCKIMQN